MKTKLGVVGAHGRLGRRICALAGEQRTLELVAGLIRDPKDEDESAGVCYSSDARKVVASSQVMIDVSAPGICQHILPLCVEYRVAYVCGTTGLDSAQLSALESAAQNIPVLVASNFSIGVNVLLKLVRQASRLLGDEFDTEIFELHHGKKRDAPSGTAMSLGHALKEVRSDLVDVVDRFGTKDERKKQDLGYAALRGGDVAGEHTVFFLGEAERLELTHRATSRDIFAHGALRAACFVSTQEPGLYGMQDVLDIQG